MLYHVVFVILYSFQKLLTVYLKTLAFSYRRNILLISSFIILLMNVEWVILNNESIDILNT